MQSYWFLKQSKINIIYNISVITMTITMSIILANFGKYAISDCPFISVCLFVCLCVCGQHYGKMCEQIFMTFSGYIGHDIRNNRENLGSVTFNPLSTGFLFLWFQRNLCLLATLRGNGWTDFHEIFSKGRTCDKEESATFLGCCRQPLESRVDFSISWIHAW